MKLIRELNEYKDIIRQNKELHKAIDTNCFLMSASMNKFISEHRLYAQKYDNGIAVYIDEGNYYNMYYFWKKDTPPTSFKQDKPIIIEELNNCGTRDAYFNRFEPLLLNVGFIPFKTNLQLEYCPDKDKDNIEKSLEIKQESLKTQGLRLSYCNDQACLEQVIALWDSSLDIADIPMEHRKLDDNAKILCVLNDNNNVIAASWWHHANSGSESRHIVTHSDYYQRGIASTMLLVWFEDTMKRGIHRCFTWISEHNFRSLSMYEKQGFVLNGRISKQYILK